MMAAFSSHALYMIFDQAFIGRLGPLVLLASLQSLQKQELFLRPEEKILIG